ncbi:MAG: response regulator [Pseudomonadota bacterium]
MKDEQSIILIVDDEQDIREQLAKYLERQGFAAHAVASAALAREWLDAHTAHLVVLDIMMPGEDGLSLCRSLREHSRTPVILLTAMADDTDRIVGLEIGADDYVTKPFNARELTARIRAILRRVNDAQGPAPAKATGARFAGWTLDAEQAELHNDNGVIVPLSAGELALLSVFLEHPGETLSRDALMAHSRGRASLPYERTIDNIISRLRRKIELDPRHPRIIKTVWGGGYRLVRDIDGD